MYARYNFAMMVRFALLTPIYAQIPRPRTAIQLLANVPLAALPVLRVSILLCPPVILERLSAQHRQNVLMMARGLTAAVAATRPTTNVQARLRAGPTRTPIVPERTGGFAADALRTRNAAAGMAALTIPVAVRGRLSYLRLFRIIMP